MADNEDIDFGQMSEALNDKAENRIAGDNALQEQIDAIVSKQELADIVGTYADLQAYDKSKLQNNAIIEVLQDETHDNAVSYYKFNSSSQSFSYIGSTAATYTKQESDAKYVKLTGAETIEGTKTFNTTPIVGTVTSGDNSTKAASTAFVQTAISTAGNNYVHLTGNETVGGAKTFTSHPTVSISGESCLILRNTSINGVDAVTGANYIYTIAGYASGYNIANMRIKRDTDRTQLTNNVRNFSEGSKHIQSYFTVDGYNDGSGSLSLTASNSTTDTMVPTKGWVNNPETSTNVVHRSGNETISGTKTFNDNIITLGYIKGTTETGSAITNHAIALGHSNVNHMDFFEYGGVFNFYKSRSGENTLLLKYVDPYQLVIRWEELSEEDKLSIKNYRQYLLDYTKEENWWKQNPKTYDEWVENPLASNTTQ